MSAPAISLLADFDRDGTFETDLTTRISSVAGGRLGIQWGMTEGGKYRIGGLTAVLNNDDGAFTPEYTSGTYYGQLDDPGIPLKVQAVHNSITYAFGPFYSVSWEVEGGLPGENSVSVKAEDRGTYLARRGQVNVSMATDRDESEAIQAILTAAGFTSSDWDLDPGLTALPYHFESNADAMKAVGAAAASGLGGQFYCSGNGLFRYENRNSRLGTSQFERTLRRLMATSITAGKGFWLRNREGHGTTVYDHTGNGCNGTLASGAAPAASAVGNLPYTSVQLDGSNDHITIADSNALDVVDSFTLGFLFHLDTLPADANDDVLLRRDSWMDVIIDDATSKLFWRGPSGADLANGSVALTANTNYLVVLTKSGSTLKVYINGTDVTENVVNQTYGATYANTLYIGNWSSGSFGLPARMADVWLADDAWTAADVLDLYLAFQGGYWGDSSTVTPCVPPRYDRGLDEMVSRVTASGRYFREGQELEIARDPRTKNPFDSSDVSTLSLAAGQVLVEDLIIPGALVSLVTPAANVDYLANTTNDGSGTDRTSSLGVTLTQLAAGVVRRTLVNNHASDTIYVTLFRIRATPLQMLTEVAQTVVDEDAPTGQPAKQEVALSIPWVSDDTKLRDFAVQVYETYSWPYPRLSLQFAWEDDDTIRDMLWLDTGFTVRAHDRDSGKWGTYVKDTWCVGEIAHNIQPGGQSFTTVTLHPSWLNRKLDAIAWDDFDRASASGDLGRSRSDDTWAGDSGWDISSNEAVPNTDDVTLPYIDLGTNNHDMVVGFDFDDIDTASGCELGVQVRRVDDNNGWRCYVDTTDSQLKLVKVVSGTPTTVATASWTPVTGAKGRVLVQDDRWRVWLNRKLVIDSEDAQFNYATIAGLYSDDANAEGVCRRWYAQAV